MTVADSVSMDFERVLAILEVIGDRGTLSRELFGFAHRNKARTQVIGQRGSEDKAARLDTDYGVNLFTFIFRSQRVYRLAQTVRAFEQRRDVIKVDAGLGKVRHFANQFF